MVSLRHSKASPRRSAPASAPDPRLRHRRLLESQAATVSSPRETKLQELKARQADLSKKVGELESVQRAVIDAYMLERQDKPTPGAKPARQGAEVAGDRSRFMERVESRLSEAGTALFRDVIGSAPVETRGDFTG